MHKRLLGFILIGILAFASTGCGTTDAAQAPSTPEPGLPTVSEPAVTETPQENPTEASQTSGVETTSPAPASIAEGYTLIEVDGGDMRGHRKSMVVVDIGFGDREYWAYTNEHGQLVRVTAAVIQLQDDQTEPLLGDGRYYPDEAKVPGTEREDLDQGHVIADSLGGVSNAYNITPQDSIMNRHGDQAYMEDTIRKAGGCTDFEAIITYPDNSTQIPSHYDYTYTITGNVIHDSFDNVNPDKANEALNTPVTPVAPAPQASVSTTGDISGIDTNGNGQVSIKEAKAAGFKMPIHSDHWLYQHMTDGDGDGMVGSRRINYSNIGGLTVPNTFKKVRAGEPWEYATLFNVGDGNILLSDGYIILNKEQGIDIAQKLLRTYEEVTDAEILAFNESVNNGLDLEQSNFTAELRGEEAARETAYIQEYAATVCDLSEQEIETMYMEKRIFCSQLIDMRTISYPLVVFFYKDDVPVFVGYNTLDLDRYVSGKRNHFEFDAYAVLMVEEKILLNVYTYFLVWLNCIHNTKILPLNGLYVTFNQIKKGYKWVPGFDLRTAKKIVELYDVKNFTFEGVVLVSKAKFDQVANSYFGLKARGQTEQKTTHPENRTF